MVRAILDNTKTQTRRVARVPPEAVKARPAQGGEAPSGSWVTYWTEPGGDEEGSTLVRCPYGRPGDRLWVREAWSDTGVIQPGMPVHYKADWLDVRRVWRSPIHMPRWASRLTLQIVDVRLERLHDMTAADARAEGCVPPPGIGDQTLREFRRLWGSINAKRGHGWDTNPWVWVVMFKRLGA